MEHSKRWYYGWVVGILAAIVVCSLAALTMGRYRVGFHEIWAVFFPGAGSQEIDGIVKNVVMNVRLPRIGLALLAGAGLSSAGAAFQALFANYFFITLYQTLFFQTV